nr:MAG TPA: hypothetical protein [Caudoviricetes sp.]
MASTFRVNWTKMNGSGSMPNTVCCGKLSWKNLK